MAVCSFILKATGRIMRMELVVCFILKILGTDLASSLFRSIKDNKTHTTKLKKLVLLFLEKPYISHKSILPTHTQNLIMKTTKFLIASAILLLSSISVYSQTVLKSYKIGHSFNISVPD